MALSLDGLDASYDARRGDGGSDGGGAPDGTPSDPAAPRVRFTDPAEGSSVAGARVTLRGAAASNSGVAAVLVSVGPNAPLLAQSTDNFLTWSVDAPVPAGDFTATAVAIDNTGRRSDTPAVLHLTHPSSAADTQAPTVQIASPANMSTVDGALALVQGTAMDDRGVVRMEVRANGVLLTDRAVATDDFFAHWSRLVPVTPGMPNMLTFTAYDAAGHMGVATLNLSARAQVDHTAPTVEFRSPRDGDALNTDTLATTGVAFDRNAVREVKLRVATAPAPGMDPSWTDWIAATSTDGFATWRGSVPVPSGRVLVQARAINVNGISTSAQVALNNSFVPQWTPESVYPLRLRDSDPRPTVRMVLDRPGINAVINTSTQQATTILNLDPTPLLTNSLNLIKTSCGTGWQLDSSNPNFDCSATALGRTFRGSDGTWRSSAEFALVRLLTMTPANVVVTGTSIEGVQNVANFIGLGGGFNQILADTLGIPRTREIITTGSVVTALHNRWMNSHPAIGAAGTIPVTLYDAMNDLAPLSTRLGPVSGHPGVLDPSVPTHSAVLQPNATMTLVADSNLRWVDGIVLSRGKDYMAMVVDTVGPTFNDVLEFNFNDPARFDITGLTPNPTVDLRLRILENAGFIASCNGMASCQGNLPATPLGTSYVWSTPQYQLENIISASGLNEYTSRRVHLGYALGLVTIDVGQSGAPAGWTHFGVPFGIGNPPRDQYLWELVGEVAQVALHRVSAGGTTTTIPEGQANVAFTLQGVPVGLTADQIRTAVRPVLQSQSSALSRMLLGDYAANNAALDFYYRRGADNVPYLWFSTAMDPRPSGSTVSMRPGFFRDEALTMKVSTVGIAGSGDSTHEMLRLNPGETVVYAQDAAGMLYRLRFLVTAGAESEINVAVSRRMR